ncbi:phytoene desaturase family protein [Pseudodonghicola flavimaris]|uniref:Pyridine nucleotide-disulfide oxidoreductase domain-containing protein 2 n=1 Tax=Pseudodonghicola flavimaris TaxID=3050036 RepID=A0ABT7EY53_9RHOB|nr:NAD(P)/FAD-dependent oxidoreductase [Pseudodonghicola flavimaris]MDK3017274.1 NAD(P)/FAD-dependent oxidoreductase [Pseudodonghicola flavimaris]
MGQKTADAIVIGAGINSLVCAHHLVSNGWSVIVLEQADVPGGAVRTGAYTAEGFAHDWAAMNLSNFAGSPYFKEHGAELMANGLEFAPASNCFASVFPDGTWLGVGQDAAANRARIATLSTADAEAWDRLSEGFMVEAEHLFALLGSRMKIRAVASIIWKALRKKGAGGSLDFARFLASTPRAWLEETFESPKLQALLGAWGMHIDFAPDIAGGAMFPYLEAMANQTFGMALGKGGAGGVIDAQCAAIRARGGEILCGRPVERILHAGGKATGVVAGGETYTARRAVIANVAPRGMLKLIGGSGDDRYDTAMRKFRHAPGTMMIHLALSDLPDWAAGPELRDFAYVHVAPSLDQMARTYAQAMAGLLPDEPIIVAGQPTAIDPSRAPEGKHVLWMQVRMAPGEIRGDAKGEITATDWAEAADPFAERAFDILDRYAPGIRDRIIARRIVSPADLEADNPNLVGGDQVCGSHHLSQHFMFRPARGFADGSTPIRGLYHTGAAVWPGASTGVGPGYQLGQMLAGK